MECVKMDAQPPETPASSVSSIERHHDNYHGRKWPTAFIRKLFKSHGEFCASQPWEVIVTTFLFLVCVLTIGNKQSKSDDGTPPLPATTCSSGNDTPCEGTSPLNHAADNSSDLFGFGEKSLLYLAVILAVSSLSILHVTYRFKKIHSLGSHFICKIALSYLLLTSVLYTLVIWSIGGIAMGSVRDAWFLIPLLTDFQKVTRMAQFALSSSHHRRICENVANGMYVLAPTFALDTVAKILLVSLGSLTGIHQLEVYSWYAVVSVMVNFLIYLTFYPAVLALVLELMYCTDGRPKWDVRQIINTLPGEDGQSPVVHRVKVIATAILVSIHLYSRPSFFFSSESSAFTLDEALNSQHYTLLCYLTQNFEKVIYISIVLVIAIKYLFYDDMDEARELRKTYIAELTRKFAEDSEQEEYNRSKVELDRASNSTDEGISLGSAKPRPPSSRGADDSSSESAWSEVNFLPDLKDQEAQTTDSLSSSEEDEPVMKEPRSLEECIEISKTGGVSSLSDDEILMLIEARNLRAHSLEKAVSSPQRAVEIRRRATEKQTSVSLTNLPFTQYDYNTVQGACCESVIGYMPVPVGVAGPLRLDGKDYTVPMATTEGCLVASVNRGCSALRQSGGVKSVITGDGMTRGPIVRFPDITTMAQCKEWLEVEANFVEIKKAFDCTSRFARLQKLKCNPAGRDLYIRFQARTGDAMGMNMLSKATESSLKFLNQVFPAMEVISLSGNFCTDKKPAAVNWLDGRGKSVICEAVIPASIVEQILKTNSEDLVKLNIAKNLVGSAMAGSIGGFNAQSANVVTAIFIATGQDAAQNVASSNCITQMEARPGGDLYVTVTMPSIEVGTVGGGTILGAQGNCLQLLGVKGSSEERPGENATQLARIVCGTVLAGELSLMSALAAGHLVKSHMRHNRSTVALAQAAAAHGLGGGAPAATAGVSPSEQKVDKLVKLNEESEVLCSEKANSDTTETEKRSSSDNEKKECKFET